MKPLALSIIGAYSCLAAIGNFSVVGTTATQALIAYTAPDGNACTIQVSQSVGLTPLALDVDPGTFANSNVDLSRPSTVASGLSRRVVIGQRTTQYATAGTYSGVRHFSRSLQAYTPYFGKITCPSTGDTLAFAFSTTNIPLGQVYGDPWLTDAVPGGQPFPEALAGLTPESFIDPQTGANTVRVTMRGNNPTTWALSFASAFNQGQTTPCDAAGPWSDPCGAIVSGGSGSTTVGASTAPLVLRLSASNTAPWTTNYLSGFSIEQIGVNFTGYVSSSNPAFQVLDACLSDNGGTSCAGPVQKITVPQTSGALPLFGENNNAAYGVSTWLFDSNPRLNAQEIKAHSGTGTVTGNGGNYYLANNTSSGDGFSLYWITGGAGTIRISSNNDACTSPPAASTAAEYRIVSFADPTGAGLNGNYIQVAGTPPTGNVYWCALNFTVMVWRDQAPTDGSTMTLSAATLHALGSYVPGITDNGAGTACFNQLVYGGFFCLWGGMYWINPTVPSIVYWGQPVSSSSGSGTAAITNPWGRTTAPMPESAQIDQTQSNFTFYVVGSDITAQLGVGGPLIIQVVFTPAAAPVQSSTTQGGSSQIGNASITASDAYSATWSAATPFSWTMKWTNLSPQVSSTTCLGVAGVGCGVVQQMASFDPTFNPAEFSQSGGSLSSGWTCSLTAAASNGIFFLDCLSYNGDSPGWLIAYSPGDGNPAHAGQAGGPQVIGAINTFNTPKGAIAPGQAALTGHNMHTVVESGETGWVMIDANEQTPITTSNTAIPASGPAKCNTFSSTLSATADCIAVQMNSFTNSTLASVASVSGTAPTGGVGNTCQLSSFNNGLQNGAATVTLGTLNSWANATIKITKPGYGASGAPTSASDSTGTASSCPTPVTIVSAVNTVTGYEPYFHAPVLTGFLGNPGELRTTQLGDTACFGTSASSCNWAGEANELMTVAIKNYGGTQGLTVFQRGTYGGVEKAVSSGLIMRWESYQSSSPVCGYCASQGMQVWWNPLTGCGGSPDPHGDCLRQDNNISMGHGEYRSGGESVTVNVPTWALPASIIGSPLQWPGDYQTELGAVPSFFGLASANEVPYAVPGVNFVSINPPFAGVYGVPFAGDAQTHPNPPGANASAYESLQAFDNVVLTGESSAPNFSWVSGQLYRYRPGTVIDADDFYSGASAGTPAAGSNGASYTNRKLMATTATCGSHPLRDVSGPGSSIGTDSGSAYTYCISRAGGECVSSGMVGDVYANCPGAILLGCDAGSYHPGAPMGVGNDICIENLAKAADTVIQYTLQHTDYFGAYTRALSSSTCRLRMVSNLENNAMLPDNSWMLYRGEFLNYDREELWMMQVPPYPALDSVNRGSFVPISVSFTPPAGTNNTVIDFGYQEYAQSGVPYCTTRLDLCEATAATIPSGYQPFKFASETPTGITCGSPPCTITIPGISQRELYYRLRYQNAGGATIQVGPWQIQGVE